MSQPPFVVAIVATHKRPEKLQCLIQSLTQSTMPFGFVVVDNADDAETARLVEGVEGFEAIRVISGSNIGCGAALALGQKKAIEHWGDKITHLVAIDDDAELEPDVFEKLIVAMEREGAILACPMILGPTGETGWHPGFLDRELFNHIRGYSPPFTRENFLKLFGNEPRAIYYATGVTVMITRKAFDELGYYATNYWMRGEDFEYTLRFTAKGKGIFVPDAVIKHLPPLMTQGNIQSAAERSRQMAMLQNCTYLSLHVPHGRRILRHLPGNFYRVFKNWGLSALPRLPRAFWRGAILRKPAGMTPPL